MPVEWAVAIAATVVTLVLHITFATHAGALWRDEVNSLGTARAGSLAELWRLEQFDSFPLLWFLLLKAWMAISGDADAGLRVFGVLGGLALPAAIWFAARRLRRGVPLVSLALLAVNPEIIRWGATVRAWGLGAGLAVIACVLASDVTGPSRRRRLVVAAIAAVLSVQCVYQNIVFVGAALVAAITIALWRRRSSGVTASLAIGGIAAVSLVPYFDVLQRRKQWSMLIEGPLGVGEIASHAESVLAASGTVVEICWLVLAGVAVLLGLWRAARPGAASSRREIGVFATLILIASLAGLTAFYLWFRTSPSPWYFVGFFGVAAAMIEAAILSSLTSRTAQTALAVAAVAIMAFGFAPAHAQLEEPQTNVDAIAARLAQEARPEDLVVVSSWYIAIAFGRYYHGPATVLSIPPIDDHTIHRYDLIKSAMQSPRAIDPLLARMKQVLEGGGQVWVVGGLMQASDSSSPQDLPAPPLPDTGWIAWPYTDRWQAQVGSYLREHVARAAAVDVSEPGGRFEAASLVVLSGWR